MPFGLCNAPGTFQRCMMAIFSDMVEKTIEVFMDDFSVLGSSFDDYLENLRAVLVRCEETNLVMNWYLGGMIEDIMVKVDKFSYFRQISLFLIWKKIKKYLSYWVGHF